jgi:hypothetical protein
MERDERGFRNLGQYQGRRMYPEENHTLEDIPTDARDH